MVLKSFLKQQVFGNNQFSNGKVHRSQRSIFPSLYPVKYVGLIQNSFIIPFKKAKLFQFNRSFRSTPNQVAVAEVEEGEIGVRQLWKQLNTCALYKMFYHTQHAPQKIFQASPGIESMASAIAVSALNQLS